MSPKANTPLSQQERNLYYQLNVMTTEERKKDGKQEVYLNLKLRLLVNLGKKY